MTDEVRVTPQDVIKAGYCVRGARRHFPEIGLSSQDFRRFVREGLTVSELQEIDDLMVQNCIKVAKDRSTNG